MRGAHPERDVERAVEEGGVLRNGERVLIACSGGPDSVALTAALHAVAKRMELTLRLAFVHHGTRSSAWQDECVVLQTAAHFGLPVETLALGSELRGEQRLRTARYDALIDAAKRSDFRLDRHRASRRRPDGNRPARPAAGHGTGRAARDARRGAGSRPVSTWGAPSLKYRPKRCARTATRAPCPTRSTRRMPTRPCGATRCGRP